MTDWARLEHAYGPATDVGDLLAEIAGGSARAVADLANRIAHQGWASCEVATRVAPHLWEIGRDPSPSRGAIAVLLADLACLGDHEHFMAGGLGRDEFADGLMGEDGYRALRGAVCAEADTALEWLADKAPKTRAGAALLLAVTQPDGAYDALVAAAAAERSRTGRSDLVAALGWFEGAELDGLRKAFARKTPDRFGGAVALAMRDELSSETAAVLATPGKLKGSVWAHGDTARHGLRVLLAACERANRRDLLVDTLGAIPGDKRGDVGATLIKIEFAEELAGFRHGTTKPRPTPDLDSLSERQRALLEQLVTYDSGWGTCNQSFWLQQLGFWNNPIQLAEYLGHAQPATVLEREVPFDGGTTTLGAWLIPQMQAGADIGPLAESVADLLDPADALEVAELILRVKVDSLQTARAFRIRLLVAQGDPAVLRARVDALAASGAWVSYWTEKGFGRVDGSLEDDLFVALKQLDPAAERPAGLRIDHVGRRYARENAAAKFGDDVASWILDVIGSE